MISRKKQEQPEATIKINPNGVRASYVGSASLSPSVSVSGNNVSVTGTQDVLLSGIKVEPSDPSLGWTLSTTGLEGGQWRVSPKSGSGVTSLSVEIPANHFFEGGCITAKYNNLEVSSNQVCFSMNDGGSGCTKSQCSIKYGYRMQDTNVNQNPGAHYLDVAWELDCSGTCEFTSDASVSYTTYSQSGNTAYSNSFTVPMKGLSGDELNGTSDSFILQYTTYGDTSTHYIIMRVMDGGNNITSAECMQDWMCKPY